MQTSERVRGFSAVELVALLIVVPVIAALVLIAGSDHRRLARLGDDVAHLKEIGTATAQYQADNGDLFWTFSWQPGHGYQTQYPDLNNATTSLDAAANQAVYLLRTKAGRPETPIIMGWLPHPSYGHLVLIDYLPGGLPNRAVVSSEDRVRQQWASDPACFDLGCFACEPGNGGGNIRWPYSASFMPGVAFFDQSPVGSRVNQASLQYNLYYTYGTSVLGGAMLSGVAFPSQKVLVHDQNARHFGSRRPYCTHVEARLPLLMVDGSVPVRAAANANPGWDPNQPTNPLAPQIVYSSPPCWDPPSLQPGGDYAYVRFRYTRQGIAGRDFGGPERP